MIMIFLVHETIDCIGYAVYTIDRSRIQVICTFNPHQLYFLDILIAIVTVHGKTGLIRFIEFIICSSYSLEFVTCLILGHFRSFFEGVHQLWASIAEGVGGWKVWMGRKVSTASEKPSKELKLHSEDTDTRAVYIVSREAQWTQPWLRVQSQVDVIHLVHSKGVIIFTHC